MGIYIWKRLEAWNIRWFYLARAIRWCEIDRGREKSPGCFLKNYHVSNLMGQIWIGECSFSSGINLNHEPNPNTTEQYIILALLLLLAFITFTFLLNHSINNYTYT